MSTGTVTALGKLSATLETAEDARGHLYAFHRLTSRADLDLLAGRDVIGDGWTVELVEAYDAQYHGVFRNLEQHDGTS